MVLRYARRPDRPLCKAHVLRRALRDRGFSPSPFATLREVNPLPNTAAAPYKVPPHRKSPLAYRPRAEHIMLVGRAVKGPGPPVDCRLYCVPFPYSLPRRTSPPNLAETSRTSPTTTRASAASASYPPLGEAGCKHGSGVVWVWVWSGVCAGGILTPADRAREYAVPLPPLPTAPMLTGPRWAGLNIPCTFGL